MFIVDRDSYVRAATGAMLTGKPFESLVDACHRQAEEEAATKVVSFATCAQNSGPRQRRRSQNQRSRGHRGSSGADLRSRQRARPPRSYLDGISRRPLSAQLASVKRSNRPAATLAPVDAALASGYIFAPIEVTCYTEALGPIRERIGSVLKITYANFDTLCQFPDGLTGKTLGLRRSSASALRNSLTRFAAPGFGSGSRKIPNRPKRCSIASRKTILRDNQTRRGRAIVRTSATARLTRF